MILLWQYAKLPKQMDRIECFYTNLKTVTELE